MENRNLLITNWILITLIICVAAISRILPHIPNITPIGGLALFSGAFLKNKFLRFLVPLLAMFISDIFLGFHATMFFVYGSFILNISISSILLQNKYGPQRLIPVTLLCSLLFFLITNAGVWITSTMYSKDLQGLMLSYFYGIPFFRNTLIGDLFYSTVFFYGFLFLKNKISLVFLNRERI